MESGRLPRREYQPTTECNNLSRFVVFRRFQSHYNECCFILRLTSELTNAAARSDVTSPSTSSPHPQRGVYDSFPLHVSTEFLPQKSICLVSHSPLEGLVLREVIIVVAGSNRGGFLGTCMGSFPSSFLHSIEALLYQRFSVHDSQRLRYCHVDVMGSMTSNSPQQRMTNNPEV